MRDEHTKHDYPPEKKVFGPIFFFFQRETPPKGKENDSITTGSVNAGLFRMIGFVHEGPGQVLVKNFGGLVLTFTFPIRHNQWHQPKTRVQKRVEMAAAQHQPADRCIHEMHTH